MAKLTAPSAESFDLGPLAPSGPFVATCLDIVDQFGVERPTFNDPSKNDIQDVTRFLFGLRAEDGRFYRVQTFEFRISGSPKSNLVKFLTAWLGRAPAMGWDYLEMKGQGAMITVSHKPSRDGTKTYANIVGIAPVIAQLRNHVIPAHAFPTVATASPTPTLAPTPIAHRPHNPEPVVPTTIGNPQSAFGNPANVVPFAPQPAATVAAVPQAAWDPSVDPESNCPF